MPGRPGWYATFATSHSPRRLRAWYWLRPRQVRGRLLLAPRHIPAGLLGLAAAHDLDLVQTARMLAMAHVAGGDALITNFDAKYTYWFWRPYQSIPAEDPAALGWQPLRTTPNHPEYPSAHASHTGAIAEALRGYFGTDAVSLTLDSRITGTTPQLRSPPGRDTRGPRRASPGRFSLSHLR